MNDIHIVDYIGNHVRAGDRVCYPLVISPTLAVGLVERVGADYVIVDGNKLSQRQFIKVRVS